MKKDDISAMCITKTMLQNKLLLKSMWTSKQSYEE